MKEELIKKTTYKSAKKKGFDIRVCRCGGFPECICQDPLPTQALLQRWIRETYHVSVEVNYLTFGVKKCNGWYYCFKDPKKGDRIGMREYGFDLFSGFKTYESALEVGLQQALQFIRK